MKLQAKNKLSRVIDILDTQNIDLVKSEKIRYQLTGQVAAGVILEFTLLLQELSFKERTILNKLYF